MKICYQRVDCCGEEFVSDVIQDSFLNIKINNIETDYFEGNKPMPNSQSLEISLLNSENARLFEKNIKQEAYFKS